VTPAGVRDGYAIELEGFDEFLKKLEELEQGSGQIGQEIVNAMQAALDVLGDNIDARTPVNNGALRGSRSSELRGTPLHLIGETGTPLAYGWPVERGRKPGGKMPPVDAIEMWVKRKGIVFQHDGQALSSRQTAWIIAASIKVHGTKGAFMYRDGLAASVGDVNRIWDDLQDRIMKELAS
jgi:hypothetical protein